MDDGRWESTAVATPVLRLHRAHNPGLFELAGQYSNLRASDFPPTSYRLWVHRTGTTRDGYAIAHVSVEEVVFLEFWCPCIGFPDRWLRSYAPEDLHRLDGARALLRSIGSRKAHRLLRVPEDNPFGTVVATRFRLPLSATLLLSARNTREVPGGGHLRAGHSVRRFRDGDEDDYARIQSESSDRPVTPETMGRWARAQQCESFSAVYRDRVVGLFIAEVRRGGRLGDFNIAVDGDFRHRGLGSALLAAGIQSFRRRGVTEVIADYWGTNAAAVAFYRKHGFQIGRTYSFFRVV